MRAAFIDGWLLMFAALSCAGNVVAAMIEGNLLAAVNIAVAIFLGLMLARYIRLTLPRASF